MPNRTSLDAPPFDGSFDPTWYRNTYADVAELGMDPWTHYVKYGKVLGRHPNSKHQNSVKGQKTGTGTYYLSANETINESFNNYNGPKVPPLSTDSSKLPKVTVVITAHNAACTIVRAVESMIFQSWPNLEIIVVDDASDDGTWEQISTIAKKYKPFLHAIRLQRNMGTYLAKNIGIKEAAGEIIMFQDSDDYSHPDRVTVQAMHLCQNPDTQLNRTKYCRFNPHNGQLVRISGHETKFGLITLAVRKSLFDKIGFFNPVRRAGDDEWFERARSILDQRALASIDVTLYMAELRPNSLAHDLLSAVGPNEITQKVTGDRAEYNLRYLENHKERNGDAHHFKIENPAVPKVAPAWIPNNLAAIPKRRIPVIAAMCSIPSRTKAMEKAVRSIIDQVDQFSIYLDKYELTPDFLNNDPRITVIRSQEVDQDFRDNAKFLPYNTNKQKINDFFYITLDDDICYPHDYVHSHLDVSKQFDYGCVTGLHGVVYEEFPTTYFGRRLVNHFKNDPIQCHTLVNCLGTGTTAFHSKCFSDIDPRLWKRGGMVDIYFSIHAKAQGVPMMCIARSSNWLTDAERAPGGPTLYDEFKEKDALIVAELERHSPWGYAGISKTVEDLPQTHQDLLKTHMPAFASQIKLRNSLSRYRG